MEVYLIKEDWRKKHDEGNSITAVYSNEKDAQKHMVEIKKNLVNEYEERFDDYDIDEASNYFCIDTNEYECYDEVSIVKMEVLTSYGT